MIRRIRPMLGVLTLAWAASGCSDSAPLPAPMADPSGVNVTEATVLDPDNKRVILANVLNLIRDAALSPAGENFNIATENLNDYFLDTRAEDFELDPDVRAFLESQALPPGLLETIQGREFRKNDGRHIEDSLMYQAVALRVAGEGDDLTRVRRVFDWVMRNVTLVPNGALTVPGIPQAQARPYDVLIRGMGTEERGGWSERGWVFLVLCRQLGLDAGLVVYNPPGQVAGPLARGSGLGPMALEQGLATALTRRPAKVWACAVLIDGKVYLFDPTVGLEVPSADGRGVATLEEAATNPRVLARFQVPGRVYEPTVADLAAPVRILLESSPGAFAPRMRLLQRDLAGKNRMVLYRDPVEQADAFRRALGSRCEGVELWNLPLLVEYNLFHDGNFMTASMYSLEIFNKRWPLLGARLMQLRGDTAAAVQQYVVCRYAERAVETDGKTPIAPQVQRILDIYATYYLALAQLEMGDRTQARKMLEQTMADLPEPSASTRYYFAMFRWGAATNLGMLLAETGEIPLAIRYLTRSTPTPQELGNLIRARDLLLEAPFVPPAETPDVIPPAPAETLPPNA